MQQRTEEPNASKTTKFNVGDKVRISQIKGVFEQEYLPNWSKELFEIPGTCSMAEQYVGRLKHTSEPLT